MYYISFLIIKCSIIAERALRCMHVSSNAAHGKYQGFCNTVCFSRMWNTYHPPPPPPAHPAGVALHLLICLALCIFWL